MEESLCSSQERARLSHLRLSGLVAKSDASFKGSSVLEYVLEEEIRPVVFTTSSCCPDTQSGTLQSVSRQRQDQRNIGAIIRSAPDQIVKLLQDALQGAVLAGGHSKGTVLPALNLASISSTALPSKPRRRRSTSCKVCRGSSSKRCGCTPSITFASASTSLRKRPSWKQLLAHPVATLGFIPKDTSLFIAGALAGATAKTVTAPLDRLKLLLQVQDVNMKAGTAATTLPQAVGNILKNEGVLGFWKGNVPQVVRILPYSAVQLFSYEFFKKLFKGNAKELSVPGRLAAGACAGMTSTLITFPLDTLRFKMAIEPDMRTMSQAAVTLFRKEGAAGYYRGLGPALLGIAPYIAINFCAYDLVKKAFPEDKQKLPQVSLATAVVATTLATVSCYPLDTIRRQMQVSGCQYTSVLDAFPAIIKKHGVAGLYRGFLINALKNLPTSSIRLTTYQSAKNLIARSEEEWKALLAEGEDLK